MNSSRMSPPCAGGSASSGWFCFIRCLPLFILAIGLCGCQLPGFLSPTGSKSDSAGNNPCIVLALPNSGPYASFATKIKKGATMAQQDLKAQGVNLRLENLDTQTHDWLARLEALPPICAVVGGPLQNKAYEAAKKTGALDRRVFFSFTPTLQKGDEGKNAWRFFPSRQDQIDALVGFATDELNIRAFGSFYPTDSYGPRMTELLEKKLEGAHIQLHKASYNPASPATWEASARPLINPVTTGPRSAPVPQTMFEAIFLPDSWKHMDMLTTSLMYNGEDRLVLMGTTLWEQGLSGKQIPKAERYALAVFPGPWDSTKTPAKLKGAGNDFWVALGFDFINFAVNTGIVSRLESADITARAQKSSSQIRGMAPMRWDNSGIAHQKLYLFQVGPQGMRPMNPESFKTARRNIQEQAALRMQGLPSASEEDTQSGELPQIQDTSTAPGTVEQINVSEPAPTPTQAPEKISPKPAAPVLPGNQIMSPVPQPSYKLRLPSKS